MIKTSTLHFLVASMHTNYFKTKIQIGNYANGGSGKQNTHIYIQCFEEKLTEMENKNAMRVLQASMLYFYVFYSFSIQYKSMDCCNNARYGKNVRIMIILARD